MNNTRRPRPGPDTNTRADHTYSRMQTKKKTKHKEFRGWILAILFAVVLALSMRLFVFEFIRVEGPCMEPTLYTDQRVFVDKISYHFTEPQRNEVVICFYPRMEGTYVKRIAAVAGDVVEIIDGKLYINGELADDKYFKGTMNEDMPPFSVPEDYLFVMGDNRNNALDSRNPIIGPIPEDQILGKALFIIWPIDKWSIITH